MAKYRLQDPDDKMDHAWNFRDKFLAADELIATATVFVAKGDIEVAEDPAVTHDGDIVTAWLEGGTAGTEAKVTARVITDQGRKKDWTVIVRITER